MKCGLWVGVVATAAAMTLAGGVETMYAAQWSIARQGMVGAAMGGSHAHGSNGYLGVETRDVSDDEAATLKLKETHGAEIINVGGTEPVTTQEYCQMAGEVLGKEPVFAQTSKAWPIWADTTKMVELLGPNQVSVREGVRRTIESATARLNTAHHVIGEPAKV